MTPTEPEEQQADQAEPEAPPAPTEEAGADHEHDASESDA